METRFPTASPTARRPTQGSGLTNPAAGSLTPANLPSCLEHPPPSAQLWVCVSG
jgi:hypothetical protein